MKTPPAIGSRVRFSKAWLQSACAYTGDLPRLRGTVTAIRTFKTSPPLVAVLWDHPYFAERVTHVLLPNLETCRSPHR